MAWVEVPASAAAWSQLDVALRGLSGATRVLVVRIVAPSDLASDSAPDSAPDPGLGARVRVPEWLGRPDLISVATVATSLRGAPLALVLNCDFRVLVDGVTLDAAGPDFLGGVRALVGLIGHARALELCLTGRRVGASEAVAIGLATATVARDQVDDAVADLVAAVLATPRPLASEVKALVSASADSVARAQRLAAEYAASERLARDGT